MVNIVGNLKWAVDISNSSLEHRPRRRLPQWYSRCDLLMKLPLRTSWCRQRRRQQQQHFIRLFQNSSSCARCLYPDDRIFCICDNTFAKASGGTWIYAVSTWQHPSARDARLWWRNAEAARRLIQPKWEDHVVKLSVAFFQSLLIFALSKNDRHYANAYAIVHTLTRFGIIFTHISHTFLCVA